MSQSQWRGLGGAGRGIPINLPPMSSPGRADTNSNATPGFGNAGSRPAYGGGGGGFENAGNTGFGGGGNAGIGNTGFGNSSGGGGFASATVFGGGGGDQAQRGNRGCRNCGEDGHFARECPKAGEGRGGGDHGPRTCRKCNEEGHIARDCPKAGPMKCYNCEEEGHLSKDCPEPRRDRCRLCGNEGHTSKECILPVSEDPTGMKAADEKKPKPSDYVPNDTPVDELMEQSIRAGRNFDQYFNDDVPTEITGENIDEPITMLESFDSQSVAFPVVLERNIRAAGYTKPTPIQAFSIPFSLKGRDIMGCAWTGSGKTAAYLLPILAKLIEAAKNTPQSDDQEAAPIALIVAPTRELVKQIKDDARKFTIGTNVKVAALYGGTNVATMKEKFKCRYDLIVATAGRLLDWATKKIIHLDRCKYLVMDEADRLLDLGFEPEMRRLVEGLDMPSKADRQTFMFSATFTEDIQGLATNFLNNHVCIKVGKIGAACRDIVQQILPVGRHEKKDKLVQLVREDLQQAEQDERKGWNKKTLVFVERKRYADFYATYLSQEGLPATSIHGDREQKEREEALAQFKSGQFPILVGTSLASRGLDIKDVDHIINFDLPQEIADYVHRIGRTGRIGNAGRATSFYDAESDKPLAKNLKEVLVEALQEVPSWLLDEIAENSGGAGDEDADW